MLGGLTLSTLLSLLVVPAFYVVTDGFKQRLLGKSREAAAPVTMGDTPKPPAPAHQ